MKQNKEILLTIIVSNYNQKEYLVNALNSINKQRVNFLYEIIITDDNSTKDDSVKFIKEFIKTHKNTKAIFSKKNTGYLSNIVRAKEKTKTKYFCLLDADDYWTDYNYLQNAVDFLEANSDYTIYESNVDVLSLDSKINKSFVSKKFKSGTYTINDYVNKNRIPITQTTGMFFRNVIFINGIPNIMKNAIGTNSERSFEGDFDRFVMHLKFGKVYYDNKSVGVYRLTNNGIWSKTNMSQKNLITAKAFMDHYLYYENYLDFFINKIVYYMREYYINKNREFIKSNTNEIFYSKQEIEIINELYEFCSNNFNNISNYKKLVTKNDLIIKISNIISKIVSKLLK